MNKYKLITITLLILSTFLLGCVEKPVGTPTPTVTPTATVTAMPTATPTPTPTSVPTPVRVPAVYKSYVDDTYGFYQIRELNSTIPPSYTNYTLMIHAGDEVQWISQTDYTITIVNEQGLWDNTSAKLRWSYQEFDYTFNQTGTYGVYIMEYPRIPHQKIIVNP